MPLDDNEVVSNLLSNLELNSQSGLFPNNNKVKIESIPLSSKSVSTPEQNWSDKYSQYLKERKWQRWGILIFACVTTFFTTFTILGFIAVQVYKRFKHPELNFEILTNFQLETLVVSMFAQFLGVIIIITKALWDDKDQTGLMHMLNSKK